jgi:maltooligosyltrehalose trehalohydrolase
VGFLYQGQWCTWRKLRRGSPSLDLQPENFVTFLQNHDQIANTMWGQRVHELSTPGRLRAMTAWLLLGPSTPMLFQGQEFTSSSPYLYFADHGRIWRRQSDETRGISAEFSERYCTGCTAPMADPSAKKRSSRACSIGRVRKARMGAPVTP